MKNDRAGVKMEFVAIMGFLLVPTARYDVGIIGGLIVFLFAVIYIKKEWVMRQTIEAILAGTVFKGIIFFSGLVENGWNVYIRYLERKMESGYGYGLDYDTYYRPMYEVTETIAFIGMMLALLTAVWGIGGILIRGEAGIPVLRRTAKWAVEKIKDRDTDVSDIEKIEELAAEKSGLFRSKPQKTETDDSFFAPPEE